MVSTRLDSSISPPKLKSSFSDWKLNSSVGRQLLIFQSKMTLTVADSRAEATKLHTPQPQNAMMIAMSIPDNAETMFRVDNSLKRNCFCNWLD